MQLICKCLAIKHSPKMYPPVGRISNILCQGFLSLRVGAVVGQMEVHRPNGSPQGCSNTVLTEVHHGTFLTKSPSFIAGPGIIPPSCCSYSCNQLPCCNNIHGPFYHHTMMPSMPCCLWIPILCFWDRFLEGNSANLHPPSFQEEP